RKKLCITLKKRLLIGSKTVESLGSRNSKSEFAMLTMIPIALTLSIGCHNTRPWQSAAIGCKRDSGIQIVTRRQVGDASRRLGRAPFDFQLAHADHHAAIGLFLKILSGLDDITCPELRLGPGNKESGQNDMKKPESSAAP